MNRGFLGLMATIGGYIPTLVLLGDNSILNGRSILGGLTGGLFDISLGMKLYRRYG